LDESRVRRSWSKTRGKQGVHVKEAANISLICC
jgi:hypothetical protein